MSTSVQLSPQSWKKTLNSQLSLYAEEPATATKKTTKTGQILKASLWIYVMHCQTSLSPSLHVTAILYIALARLFPDLKVLDCEESSLESTPFASPTRQLRTPKKVAAVRRPLYRPSRPNSENAPKTSYVAIVNHWLYPYMDEKSSISHIHSTYRPVH